MNRIYLHVGMHKTGTTALQQFFYANRERLLGLGLCYPDIRIPHHAPLAAALREDNRQPLLDVLRAKSNAKHPSVLISAEDFVRQASRLAFVKEEAPAVTVILYLRRQDYYVQSIYQETVKSPDQRATWGFDEYYRTFWNKQTGRVNLQLNWHYLVEDWARVFGRENVIVRPYDRKGFAGGNIFAEFLSLLGLSLDEGFVFPPPEKTNVGLSRELVELIRAGNASRNKREQAELVKLINESSTGDAEAFAAGRKYDYLSPAERVRLLEDLEESNSRVAREYLHREDGRLFLEPWPDPSQPWEEPSLSLERAVPPISGLINRQQHRAESLMNLLQQARARIKHLERVAAITRTVQVPAKKAKTTFLSARRLRREAKLVEAGGLFDADYYLATYPDVKGYKEGPAAHYVAHGWHEGRNPSAAFDTLNFLMRNPDVLATGRCPLAVLAERKGDHGSRDSG